MAQSIDPSVAILSCVVGGNLLMVWIVSDALPLYLCCEPRTMCACTTCPFPRTFGKCFSCREERICIACYPISNHIHTKFCTEATQSQTTSQKMAPSSTRRWLPLQQQKMAPSSPRTPLDHVQHQQRGKALQAFVRLNCVSLCGTCDSTKGW